MKYKLKMGLEIHVQVNTRTKLFSSSETEFTANPNSHINYFDLAIPGVLPRLNEEVMRKAICAGKILNCRINNVSKFDRKHYYYPDLPLGYQITQFYYPICEHGNVTLSDGKDIRINRIHIETDAGKLIHDNSTYQIDYNRCGNPLLEIVTEPDFSSAEQVGEFLRVLIRNLEYGNISNCDMEKGNLRCDINISIYDDKVNHPRVEIKNVNSVEFVKTAIEFEYQRQIYLVERGEKYSQHTRGYRNGETKFMRDKETSDDYRYIPCGNLPRIVLSDEYIASVVVPETYDVKFEKYNAIFNNIEITQKLLSDLKLLEYFEGALSELKGLSGGQLNDNMIKLVGNFIACDLVGLCKDEIRPYTSSMTMEYIALIVNHLINNRITTRVAKDVLIESFNTGLNPISIIKAKGLEKITDESVMIGLIEEIKVVDNATFEKWKAGAEKLENAIVGYAMKKTNGSVDVDLFKMILKKYR